MGVARSSSAPTQTSGLTRSGSVELMLPMEVWDGGMAACRRTIEF